MNTVEQIQILNKSKSFKDKLREEGLYPLRRLKSEILQLNITKKCNLACTHCHVESSMKRIEMMERRILEKALEIVKNSTINTVDITGGAPEMHALLPWFINELSKYNIRIIIRTNLVILEEENYSHYINIFTQNKVELCASVPCYTKETFDKQRGKGSFDKAIKVIKILNNKGYGKQGSGLILNLVCNPVGTHLSPDQKILEETYKLKLREEFDIEFNNLFCISNMPIGRYLNFLVKTGKYEEYMDLLVNSFNPNAALGVMCRNTISVDSDGVIYDCDFNQMLKLPIRSEDKKAQNIMDIDFSKIEYTEIIFDSHCFGCTAGNGSSCQGEIK